MLMTMVVFLLFGLIDQLTAIECYTCNEEGYFCPLPLNLDGGDESNENEIETSNYHHDYACMSDHSFNPHTGTEKIILRGIAQCTDIDEPNHRVYCCYDNHCNKQLPPMNTKTFADLMSAETSDTSSAKQHLSSILLIGIGMLFRYVFLT